MKFACDSVDMHKSPRVQAIFVNHGTIFAGYPAIDVRILTKGNGSEIEFYHSSHSLQQREPGFKTGFSLSYDFRPVSFGFSHRTTKPGSRQGVLPDREIRNQNRRKLRLVTGCKTGLILL
jgi:hypothetical protein